MTTVHARSRRQDRRVDAGAAAPSPRRLAPPRPSRAIPSDVRSLVIGISAVTVGLWAVHGGVNDLMRGGTDAMLSLGRILGLAAGLVAMAGVILAVRPRSVERLYGLDRLWAWHRLVGISMVVVVLAHAVVDTVAWASAADQSLVAQLVDFVQHEPWMLAAVVGTLLIALVGLTSWRRIRRSIAYESWYFIHLTAYLAVLLAFGHQVTMGTDLVSDPAGTAWWVALSVAALAIILGGRLGGLMGSLRRGTLLVTDVRTEAAGMGSLRIAGPGLRSLRASAGQFFMVRVLTRGLWWQSHPFSLSAAPTADALRFTIKELGDGSRDLLRVRRGARVLLEGPYGRFTAEGAGGARVLLVAGGAGIAPIRALLEDLSPAQRPVVVVRLRCESEFAHREEMERLVAERSGVLYLLAGPRRLFASGDPFRGSALATAIPDIRDRHAFLCGPASLERAVERGLRELGVPAERIHVESFGV